jgi:two-component system sensor histidine kinase MprB
MSFRRRVVLLAAGAVAAAVLIASAVVYVVTSNELHGQLDDSLRAKVTPGAAQAVQLRSVSVSRRAGGAPGGKGSPNVTFTITESGKLLPSSGVPVKSYPAGAVAGSSGGVTAVAPPSGQAHGRTSRLAEDGVATKVAGAAAVAGALGTIDPRQARAGKQGQASGLPPILPPQGVLASPEDLRLVVPSTALGEQVGYAQFVVGKQLLRSQQNGPVLPVGPEALQVAAGKRGPFFADTQVAGTALRTLTARGPAGGVLEVALPLTSVDNTLAHLRLVLAIVCLGGVALAAGLGLLVSRAALVPVRRLTLASERVADTHDLAHRISGESGGELGRLAASFNKMLGALESARHAQRALVSDASHELRTPLTSIRANLDALATGELVPEDRDRAIASARAQLSELTVLVGDLIDLSKNEPEAAEVEDVRLDSAVKTAVERVRVHAPERDLHLHAEPCLVRAAPGRLDRAVANMLDNACKWSPSGGVVEIAVRDGCVCVRDHGPGIAEEDLPHVFDRFYRSRAARALPGSGLGLAIVRQFAELHGGTASAENHPEGGAQITLRLPVCAPEQNGSEQDPRERPPAESGSRPLAVHQVPRPL